MAETMVAQRVDWMVDRKVVQRVVQRVDWMALK
jgi:hypothetical protein